MREQNSTLILLFLWPPLHALQPPPNPFLSNEAAVAGGKEGERPGRKAMRGWTYRGVKMHTLE